MRHIVLALLPWPTKVKVINLLSLLHLQLKFWLIDSLIPAPHKYKGIGHRIVLATMGKKKKKSRDKKNGDYEQITEGPIFDGDEIMDGSHKNHRRSIKHESKRQKKQRKQLKKEKKREDELKIKKNYRGWHVITVFGAASMGKLALCNKIGEYVEHEFQPLGYHTGGSSAIFYLEANCDAAESIVGLDRRLEMSSGQKFIIKIRAIPIPDLALNFQQINVLKEVMAKRFNNDSCLLDLTKLYMDPMLLDKDILAPLINPSVFKLTMRIIRENIPHLKALNLSQNKLSVSQTKLLSSMLPMTPIAGQFEIAALNLEHNAIADRQVLKHVKRFPLKELSLEYNSFLDHIKDPIDYIKLVHKELPDLRILDKIDIEKYLKDHSHSKTEVCASTSLSTGIEVTEASLKTFLEQYYSLFDTNEKNKLIQAYTPTAKFEVQCNGTDLNGSFEGQARISEALKELPSFKHLHETFNLKILTIDKCYGCVEIAGQCLVSDSKEMISKRTMKIIQYNEGLCCSEDLLQLSMKI